MLLIEVLPTPLLKARVHHYHFAVVALVLLGLLAIGRSIYRVTRHPFSKYPGPFAAKLTSWYGAYYAARGDLHVDILRCHQRYGNIVRYGPDRLIVDSSVGLHDIYGHNKNVKKSKAYLPVAHVTGGLNVLASIEKNMYRRKRRLLSHGFSSDALKTFEPQMVDLLRKFCHGVLDGAGLSRGGWTEPKNMRDWLGSWLTFDIIGEFGYGLNFRTMEEAENRFIVDAVLALDARNGIYAQSPDLPSRMIDILWSPINKTTLYKGLKWRGKMSKMVLGGEAASRSLFSNLLEAKDPETGQGLDFQELMAEAQFLLVAGFETTATTLSSLFFYIANNPITHRKLADEIRSTFATCEQIRTGPQLQSCVYLWACIQEAMRMSPAGVGVLWREVGFGGLKVDNEYIPGGYDIGTSIYAIHHNEAYFPDSFAFKPERWLHSTSDASDPAHRAYNPFSLGPRTCIGRPLAMMEISVTLAVVIWLMDFRAAPESCGPSGRGTPGAKDGRDKVGEYQLYSHLTSYSLGPMIAFRSRKV